MHKQFSNATRNKGSFRLEAILFLLILGTLAFLAIPVYNSVQDYRNSQIDDHNGSAPEIVPAEIPDKNASTPVN
ncbi:MAG: hypothetical protein CMI32_08325 [Opitutales bacterium]|nr:hypothetical protein [Opitutales bacterium]